MVGAQGAWEGGGLRAFGLSKNHHLALFFSAQLASFQFFQVLSHSRAFAYIMTSG